MESVMKKTAATSLLASCAVSLALFSSCASQEQNTLTPEEIADGWVLLFDGKTLDGWKDYNGTTLTQPWHVVDGCIQAKGDGSDASGYIVTDKSMRTSSFLGTGNCPRVAIAVCCTMW